MRSPAGSRFRNDESGAVFVMVAMLMIAFLLLAALVVDIGGARWYRTENQLVTDSAAAAAAITLAKTGDGQQACDTAKAYIISNTPEFTVGALSGLDCTDFPTSCDAGTAEVVRSTTENGITVTIAFPVTDSSSFMASKVIGAPSQPASASDGTACERIAAGVQSTWDTAFGKVIGINSLDADVHSVARSNLPAGDSVPINLLVLERTGCSTMESFGNGGIIVGAIYTDDIDGNGTADDPGLLPGIAASDSDGSDCGGGNGVISMGGGNSIIRADGPEGCSNQTDTNIVRGLTAGEGCGKLQTLAPGTPGCTFPACTFGGTNPPNPLPTALPGRLTRAPVDHRYNCRSDYSILPAPAATYNWATSALTAVDGQDIPGCTGTDDPFIMDLIEFVGETGTPTGYTRWSDAYSSCSVQPTDEIVVPAGNWHIDCAPFSVKGTVVFDAGNIVFHGGVRLTSGAILGINSTAGTPSDPNSYSSASSEAWAFIRDGEVSKAGTASLIMHNTTMYVSKKVDTFKLTGGTGTLNWIAPNSGDLDDLALWSDSEVDHKWAGQANLNLEGVFFTPLATAIYTGNGAQKQVEAQFIADRLRAGGNGQLFVTPSFGRAVEFPHDPQSELLR